MMYDIIWKGRRLSACKLADGESDLFIAGFVKNLFYFHVFFQLKILLKAQKPKNRKSLSRRKKAHLFIVDFIRDFWTRCNFLAVYSDQKYNADDEDQ